MYRKYNDMREEVKRFSERMEAVLLKNDNKGGWGPPESEPYWLLQRLKDGVQELEEALINQPMSNIGNECADVANFAMMIAENHRRMHDGV